MVNLCNPQHLTAGIVIVRSVLRESACQWRSTHRAECASPPDQRRRPDRFRWHICILVEVVAAHLEQIRHAAQLFQVQMQTIPIQSHLTDIGTQTTDAHAQHLFIDTIFLSFCGSQDDDLIPFFSHRASPVLVEIRI